jgi:pimeloyl-ACP methyl ester carboxylesterase
MLADLTALMFDVAGAQSELVMNRLGRRWLSRIAPVARRRVPVITIPGYMGSDDSLAGLTGFLERQGFEARSWGLGRNRGLRGTSWDAHLDGISEQLSALVRRLADQCSAPVSLVGHSLGGIYARELAPRFEGAIDRVITLGSPTFHPYAAYRHNRLVDRLSSLVNGQRATQYGGRRGLLHWDADQPQLPCVAIHSPVDGLVHEDACRIPDYIVAQSGKRAPRENIRVLASHIGMTLNPWVLLALADRLLANRTRWRSFDPRVYLGGATGDVLRLMYPKTRERPERMHRTAFVEMNQ